MPVVERLPYRPWAERGQVVDGAFRWRLGVRPLDLDDWIELGPDAVGPDGWIAEKSTLNERHHDVVFAALDDIDAEATEVAGALAAHLQIRWPDEYCGTDEARDDEESGLHPLDAAARRVPEDLVLMVERNGRLVFGGGSVCFPNRWDLQSKLGLSIADVHAPVADLNEQLEPAIDNFLARLSPARSFWRLGWGLIDSPHGFEPPRPAGVGIPIGRTDPGRPRRAVSGAVGDTEAGAGVWVRVERETLRRFPVTNCVLFTIRTYIASVTSLGNEDRALIARTVDAMPDEVREYKDLTPAAV